MEAMLEGLEPMAQAYNASHGYPTFATAARPARTTCGGHPVGTFGDGPSGYVCRCSYGPGASSPSWNAVRPGNSNILSCSAPSGSSANPAFTQGSALPAPRPRSTASTSPSPRANSSNSGQRPVQNRSEEHTSELQSLMRTSYAVFC